MDVCPYDLNNQLGNKDKKVNTLVLVSNEFLPSKHKIVFSQYFSQKQKILSSDEFRIKIKHHLNHDLLDTPKFLRVSLLVMNKEKVQDTAVCFRII